MLFSAALNVLLLGVATIVSAAPISQRTSELELAGRDNFDVSDMYGRDFQEPTTAAIYRRVARATPYHVALHVSQPGTEHEHWSMHIHPQTANAHAKWHIVHALSNGGNGVLETHHEEKGGRNKGYDPALQHKVKDGVAAQHHILGSFPSAADATAAAKSLKQFHCSQAYPTHNCVDFTKQAVDHLHAEGHIGDAGLAVFNNIHNTHAETVRTNTDTPENRKKAGTK